MKKLLILLTTLSINANAEIKCREDGSTMEMRACFIDELQTEEKNLIKALDIALKRTDWIVKEIHESQDAWIKYRDAHCGAIHAADSPGTIRLISHPSCLVDLTKARATELIDSFTRHTDYVGDL